MADKPKHFLAEIEQQVIGLWEKEDTFTKSVDQRADGQHFEFYDGPPFANGLPHYGHLVSSILKDAIPRYKTMRGYHVPRRFGWDCHGLPAEMKAEQDLDLGSKADIESYGVEKFIDYCRTSVTEFTQEWQSYITRLGRWVDFDNNYYTMDQGYMESVIWAFKQMYDKDLVAEGFKVMPYCPVCETAISFFESRLDDSYRERTDTAVTLKFPLENGYTLLAWTTTPWTLPANLAVAVNKAVKYDVWEGNGERLVLSPLAVQKYAKQLEGYKKIETKLGADFVGLAYEPPFNYFVGHKNSHKVLHADFVTEQDGTGIAHEAPGFGEEDQEVCEANGIEIVVPVDKQGNYTEEITEFAGVNVFEVAERIVNHLESQGRLFAKEQYVHSYPHCWRTDNPLIYRAVSSWMIKVPQLKEELIKNNQEINWIPSNVKDGAFGQWLDGVRNWNVSRDRYWGAPIPVWKTQDGEVLVPGSLAEIKERALDPSLVTDLHKPAIDKVVLKTDSGKLAHRVSEVFDCWFESGSMPFAQHNYPFKTDKFNHPADFIVEYIGQTRGWFYTLHVVSTILWGQPAFKNCISHGVILGADGRKMSKKLGNYPDISHVFDTYGADAMRLYLCQSPVISGETIAIDEKAILDTQRNVFMTLWNTYQFFKMYSQVDKWQPSKQLKEAQSEDLLDKWIIARLNQTIAAVTEGAEAYQIPKATRSIRPFMDDLSNWYVRRSRRRFWKGESDQDKQQAYATLHYVLARTCQVLAPWAPFMADKIWHEIMAGTDEPKSVHLTDWPSVNQPDTASHKLLDEMFIVRNFVVDGLADRAEAKIKVRQPLSLATLHLHGRELNPEYLEIIKAELNVKQVNISEGIEGVLPHLELNLELTPDLRAEGTARELIRQIQNARKKAGFNIEDRIKLSVESQSTEVSAALKQFRELIDSETLAVGELSGNADYSETVKLDGQELTISVSKA